MAAAERRVPFPTPVSDSPMAPAADCRGALGPVPAGPSFFPGARARRRTLTGIAAIVLACTWPVAQAAAAPALPAEVVNTFIGTKDDGNTFPGASAPFGKIQV